MLFTLFILYLCFEINVLTNKFEDIKKKRFGLTVALLVHFEFKFKVCGGIGNSLCTVYFDAKRINEVTQQPLSQ